MATFLEGVRELARECRLPSRPSTVIDQRGDFLDIVTWYNKAWEDIQRRHKWRWLRHTASVSTVEDDDTYAYGSFTDATSGAAITRFRCWLADSDDDPPKIYLSSSGVGGERWLAFHEWDWFKALYRIGTQNSGQPAFITVDPSNRLVIGPAPNGVYVVTLDYIRGIQTLALNGDTPEMPADYHDLIVYAALIKYAYQEVSAESLAFAREEYKRLMSQLEREQSPNLAIRWGGPLVK